MLVAEQLMGWPSVLLVRDGDVYTPWKDGKGGGGGSERELYCAVTTTMMR